MAGISFGIPAGFFEEIGWTGYAIAKIVPINEPLDCGILVGVL